VDTVKNEVIDEFAGVEVDSSPADTNNVHHNIFSPDPESHDEKVAIIYLSSINICFYSYFYLTKNCIIEILILNLSIFLLRLEQIQNLLPISVWCIQEMRQKVLMAQMLPKSGKLDEQFLLLM